MAALTVHRYEHASEPQTFAASTHVELEVAWVERGAVRYRIGTREYELAIGAAIVVPPGVEHATTFLPSMTARSIKISSQFVDGVVAALGVRFARESYLVADARTVVALAQTFEREVRDVAPGQLMLVDTLTEAITIAAVRTLPQQTTANGNHDPRIVRAVELVHERFADPLTVDDLARAAAMSRFHFSRMFRAQLGVSPYRFLQDVRIDRARELLCAKHRSVTEVALSVGFTDLGRFAAMFRARVGELPSKIC